MAVTPTAYLVARREDGFGDVYPLVPGTRYSLGRSPTSRIVLRDDLCSREHAEIYSEDGQWFLRDLGSLNGSRVNDTPVRKEVRLAPHDELHLGRCKFLFLHDIGELPNLPLRSSGNGTSNTRTEDQIEIKKRLAETKYLPQSTKPTTIAAETKTLRDARSPENALPILYRLAVEMATATEINDLVQRVLQALLEAIPAEVGAVLAVKESRELEVLAYQHRNPNVKTYHKVSQYVSSEVLSSKEAILADDIAGNRQLRHRESLAELHVTSLICAPVLYEGTAIGLIHLYSTEARRALTAEDLEFALAVARQLGIVWHQLRKQTSLEVVNQTLKDQLRLESELIGQSEALRKIESQISRVAQTRSTVLIRGESGSGKELVARAIHFSSPRRDAPLVCLNCAALTETLLESELFGHEKGAFTGATERMIGKFEAADQGTLFLDEIGEMSLSTQAKFLRVLEGHPFERVGGNTPIKVDVRVVAATNRPLEDSVRAGTFRRDLFYRLQVVEIQVPPLRERLEDVPLIAEHFLKRFVRETGRKIKGFTEAALEKMRKHPWPGNVRELRNVIERAVALGNGPLIDVGDIWLSSLEVHVHGDPQPTSYEPISLEELEKRHIIQTLEYTDWNKSQAAQILGIERSTLDRKIKAYDIRRGT